MANGINPGDGRYELTSDQTYGPPPTPPKPYKSTLTISGSTANGGHLGMFTYTDPPGIFDHDEMKYAIKILTWDPVSKEGTFIAIVGSPPNETPYTGTISAA